MVLLIPLLEGGDGIPPKLYVRLMRVDRVAPVMPAPVRNVGDQEFRLAQLGEDPLNDVEVVPLVVAAEVVDLADPALLDSDQDASAMGRDVEPVPYV